MSISDVNDQTYRRDCYFEDAMRRVTEAENTAEYFKAKLSFTSFLEKRSIVEYLERNPHDVTKVSTAVERALHFHDKDLIVRLFHEPKQQFDFNQCIYTMVEVQKRAVKNAKEDPLLDEKIIAQVYNQAVQALKEE